MLIHLKAALDARHLLQLSSTCTYVMNIRGAERDYSWHERYLHCTGELRGLEIWRAYREYTLPHYLALYITIFLFVYVVIIRQGGGWLKNLFDNQPTIDDNAALSDDTLALPGAYHTLFPLSYVAKLKTEIEKAREDVKEAWNGVVVAGEMQEAEFEAELRKASKREPCPQCEGLDIGLVRKQAEFLKYDLEPVRGSENYHKDGLHQFQSATNINRSGLQKQPANVTRVLLNIENPKPCSKAARKPSSHFTPYRASAAQANSDNAALQQHLRMGEEEIKASTSTVSSPSQSPAKARRNRQLRTDTFRLMKELDAVRKQLASKETALKLTTFELQKAKEERLSTKSASNRTDTKGAMTQNELKDELGRKTNELQGARNKLNSTATTLQNDRNEWLGCHTDLTSAVEKLKGDLQQANFDLASANTKLRSREQEFQQANLDLASVKADSSRREKALKQAHHDLASVQLELSGREQQLQQASLDLASAKAGWSSREKELQQANNDLALQKQSVESTLNKTLRELEDVKAQSATAPSQQLSNYNDVVRQLTLTTKARNEKDAELQHAKKEWQNNYDHILYLRKTCVSRDVYGKALAEIQRLQNTIPPPSKQATAETDSVARLAKELDMAKDHIRQANEEIGALQNLNYQLKEQSNEEQLMAKIKVLQDQVKEIPRLHNMNKSLISQLQLAKEVNAGSPDIATIQQFLVWEQKRAKDAEKGRVKLTYMTDTKEMERLRNEAVDTKRENRSLGQKSEGKMAF